VTRRDGTSTRSTLFGFIVVTVAVLAGCGTSPRAYAVTADSAASGSGWLSTTVLRITDLEDDPRVFDPLLSWDPVAGAAQYEVEISPSPDFAIGSRMCCTPAFGTSLAPQQLLPDNTYHWRVRAIDGVGDAGVWNFGPSFVKVFDDVVPSVPGLRIRDNDADATPAAGPSGLPTTDAPVVEWEPVPGASSYGVRVVPHESYGCNWSASSFESWDVVTASTAWTPLGQSTVRPMGTGAPLTSTDAGRAMVAGRSYCIRVRARSNRDATGREVVSDWTQLGGTGQPAVTYAAPPSECFATSTPASAYRVPAHGSTASQAPLFTWADVTGACGYCGVVSRDPEVTKVIDVAFTRASCRYTVNIFESSMAEPATFRLEDLESAWEGWPSPFAARRRDKESPTSWRTTRLS